MYNNKVLCFVLFCFVLELKLYFFFPRPEPAQLVPLAALCDAAGLGGEVTARMQEEGITADELIAAGVSDFEDLCERGDLRPSEIDRLRNSVHGFRPQVHSGIQLGWHKHG